MAEAAITLNGRIYRLSCGAGEEGRLHELSQLVAAKLEALILEYGQVGDDRLLLMSALLLADELLDARARAAGLDDALDTVQKPTSIKAV